MKLKPCPFCGREVKIKKRCLKDWKGKITNRFYSISCSCGAGTHKEYKTEKAVANVWNRRHNNNICICKHCGQETIWDEMIWLNGKCMCPSCYATERARTVNPYGINE